MQKITSSQQTKNSMLAFFVASALLLLFGIVFLVDVFSSPETPVDIVDADITALKNGAVYRIDELYVVDSYAKYGETRNILSDEITTVKDLYFTCLLFGEDDTLYSVSLQTKPDDDIVTDINTYLADDEQFVGDLVLNGYFTARTGAISDDLLEYYNESVDFCKEMFELTQINTNLVYECNGDTDYTEYAKEQQQTSLVAACMFLLFGVALIGLGFFCRKLYKKQAASEAAKARAWTMEEE